MRIFLLAPALLLAMTLPVLAIGTMERACLSSNRQASSRSLCNCIQQAADRTLSASDQRTAATFFKDPDKAQDIRRSDRSSHEAFWERYTRFGALAQKYCAR